MITNVPNMAIRAHNGHLPLDSPPREWLKGIRLPVQVVKDDGA